MSLPVLRAGEMMAKHAQSASGLNSLDGRAVRHAPPNAPPDAAEAVATDDGMPERPEEPRLVVVT